ncbi:SDR family NAD(P)-dependent oxidoreductase [Sinorhizobium meliloti]|nr:SDR family NAD(P)-dependent oxidoreductase [Sinorhizobium meliloti]
MEGTLIGLNAVVTGARHGLGSFVAAALTERGAKVIHVGRATGKYLQVLEDIDVDIFIDVAPPAAASRFVDLEDDDWRQVFESNVLPGIRIMRHVMPRMLLRNTGSVVFVFAAALSEARMDAVHHGMAEAARLSLVSSLSNLARGSDVGVTAVIQREGRNRPQEDGLRREPVAPHAVQEVLQVILSLLGLEQ